MNWATQNGVSVASGNGRVVINGKEVEVPKGMNTNSQSVVNNRVFIGGYEYDFKTNKFKRSLRAIIENLF